MRNEACGAIAIAGLLVAGCDERPVGVVPPCTHSERGLWAATEPSALDLLLVIDDSASMAEEQAALIAELPRLFEILTHGDLDGDGGQEFTAFPWIHAGVVTADLGAGPVLVPGCSEGLGDDAILRQSSRRGSPCQSRYPSSVFTFGGGASNDEVVSQLGCVTDVGTSGCRFVQPLEAALKALAPVSARSWTATDYDPPRFLSVEGVPDGTAGQGEGPNLEFLRPGAVLAVLVLTDDDDCSVRDDGLFDPDDPRFAGTPLDLRCARAADHPSIERPIERYVRGLSGLRRSPDTFVFGVIAGVPTTLEPVEDLERALAEARASVRVDDTGAQLVPSCTSGRGEALPPVRLLETARDLDALGARVTVSSICGDSLAPAIDAFAAALARTQPIGCLYQPLVRGDGGLVDCSMYELLAAGQRCDEGRGRTLEELVVDDTGSGRALCHVAQVALGATDPGWFYDDTGAALELCGWPYRIGFVHGAEPGPGAEHRMVCARSVEVDSSREPWCDADHARTTPCRVGMFCDRDDDRCGTAGLSCDPVHALCGIPCESDEDCVAAGADARCDLRSLGALLGPAAAEPERPRRICVRPTCGP
ncbi:MAG: hypothetical protein K1X94_12170 [Sandaracinaceae bacterium]|nr:hypothetical protein [Sandaracinaceae bacterium]